MNDGDLIFFLSGVASKGAINAQTTIVLCFGSVFTVKFQGTCPNLLLSTADKWPGILVFKLIVFSRENR